MTLLSIAIPSKRNLANSVRSLESALIYAEKADCQVIVADNSGDPEKRRRFEHASPRLIYLDTTDHDAMQNMMAALGRVDTPFVLPMGDDDEVYLLDQPPRLDLRAIGDDVIGVRPVTMAWSLNDGVRSVDRFTVTAPDADDRIRQFAQSSRNVNSLYYSIYRTSLFRGLFQQFDRHHPTHGGYCDWAIVTCFVASGRILHDPATIFRYDLGRWADKSSLEESKLTLFRQVGLPDEAERYSALLRFIDTHCLIMWKDLPLSDDQRYRALVLNAQMALSAFVPAVEAKPGDFHAEARAFAERSHGFSDLGQAFAMALPVVDRLRPGLGAQYADFLAAVTG